MGMRTIPVSVDGGNIKASISTGITATTAGNATNQTVDFDVQANDYLLIKINVSANTLTTGIQFFWEQKSADGLYYIQWSSAQVSTTGNITPNGSIGTGCRVNEAVGAIGRLRWVCTGTGSATFTYEVLGS